MFLKSRCPGCLSKYSREDRRNEISTGYIPSYNNQKLRLQEFRKMPFRIKMPIL